MHQSIPAELRPHGNLPSKAKKKRMSRGSARLGGGGLGGWTQLELTDAHIALVNSAVRCNIFVFKLQNKKKNETRMRKHEFFIWR